MDSEGGRSGIGLVDGFVLVGDVSWWKTFARFGRDEDTGLFCRVCGGDTAGRLDGVKEGLMRSSRQGLDCSLSATRRGSLGG